MIKKIFQIEAAENVLKSKARRLTLEEIRSNEIKVLIEEMKETMRNAPGVGLAAPQIGKSIQLAVIEDADERLKTLKPEVLIDRDREPVKFHVIINPIIKKMYGKINYFFEGCLSVKGCVRVTPRYHDVEVDCLDENGDAKTIIAHGWYARILQHEIDHLNGRLYVDVADERTELEVNEEYKATWMNAMQDEIISFHKKCCKNNI